MSEYIILGMEINSIEKREDCETVRGSTGEVISLHKGTKPINLSPSINSNCSSASTSAVSSHAATTNFRIAGNRGLQLKQMSYKCFAIEASKICNSDFYSNASISSIHTSSNGQYGCPFIFSKDGEYPQQSSYIYKQRDLELLVGQQDHSYSRISSRCSQEGSRFPVASSERLK